MSHCGSPTCCGFYSECRCPCEACVTPAPGENYREPTKRSAPSPSVLARSHVDRVAELESALATSVELTVWLKAERDAAYARGRADERADVVSLLRGGVFTFADYASYPIERGDHVTPPSPLEVTAVVDADHVEIILNLVEAVRKHVAHCAEHGDPPEPTIRALSDALDALARSGKHGTQPGDK